MTMTKKHAINRVFSALLLFLLCPAFLKADDQPQAELSPLYQLVGDDVGSCIEFSNLKEQVPQFVMSTFFQRLQKASFYQSWKNGNDYKKLEAGLKEIEKLTGSSAEDLAAKLFGESAIIAIYPSSEGEPKGLLLTKVQNEQTMQEMIRHWNKADGATIEKRSYAEVVYYMRKNDPKKKRKKEVVYYLPQHQFFALAGNEDIIHKVIDLSNATKERQTPLKALAASAAFHQMHASLSKDSAIRLFINPRAWDNEVKADKNSDKGDKAIVNLWKQCRSISFGLQMKDGLIIEAVIKWNRSALSEKWQQFVKATSGQSAIMGQIPASAIVVACGKFDGTVFKHFFEAVTSQKDRDQLKGPYTIARSLLLDLDPFDDVLSNLGANWGAWIQPTANQKEGTFPLESLLITDFNNPYSTSKRKDEIPDALENVIITGLNGLTVLYNSKLKANQTHPRALLRRKKYGKTVVRWVETSPAWQLAIGLSPNLLLISNSPHMIEQFVLPAKQTKELFINSTKFKKWSSRYFAATNELLYVDVASIRKLIKENEAFFIQKVARKKGQISSFLAKQRIAHIREVLSPVDVLFIGVRYADDGIQIKMGIVAE